MTRPGRLLHRLWKSHNPRLDLSRPPSAHGLGIGEFRHCGGVAIEHLVFGEIVETPARDVADEGFGGGAFGEDDVMCFGFDVIARCSACRGLTVE